MAANAREFVNNKLLNDNSFIDGCRPFILNTLSDLFENDSASAAMHRFNISDNLQSCRV
jgi:hypothetical protein